MFAMDTLNNWLLSFYNPNKGKITLQQKLILPFSSSLLLLCLVIVDKLLPTTFSNDSWRVLIGSPSIRTLLPSLLVSLKKRLALFITNLFFLHQSLSLFATEWQSFEVICSTNSCVCSWQLQCLCRIMLCLCRITCSWYIQMNCPVCH